MTARRYLNSFMRNASPTRFIIWFNQRSGSTHLSSLLDSHPQLACWREIFYRGEGNVVDDEFTRSGLANVHKFLESFYLYKWGAGGTQMVAEHDASHRPAAIGFKLKYQQADRYPEIDRYLRKDAELKVIHLVRKNLLATLVSSVMLPSVRARFGSANVKSDVALGEFCQSMELDASTVGARLSDLGAGIARARTVVAHLPVLEITYEDLMERHADTCKSILTFLGVDPMQSLSSEYRKILPNSLESVISNVHQIRGALSGTCYEEFLS